MRFTSLLLIFGGIAALLLACASSEDGMTVKCKDGIAVAKGVTADEWLGTRSEDSPATQLSVEDYYSRLWKRDPEKAKQETAKVLSDPEFNNYVLRRTIVSFNDPQDHQTRVDIVCSWLTPKRDAQPLTYLVMVIDGKPYADWLFDLATGEVAK